MKRNHQSLALLAWGGVGWGRGRGWWWGVTWHYSHRGPVISSFADLFKIHIVFHISYYSHFISLQWRHNGRDSVSNHQPHDCLLNRLFRRRSKKTSKLPVTGLCVGNSPGTGEFPAQMTSNTENVSIWWRHHVILSIWRTLTTLNFRQYDDCGWVCTYNWVNWGFPAQLNSYQNYAKKLNDSPSSCIV